MCEVVPPPPPSAAAPSLFGRLLACCYPQARGLNVPKFQPDGHSDWRTSKDRSFIDRQVSQGSRPVDEMTRSDEDDDDEDNNKTDGDRSTEESRRKSVQDRIKMLAESGESSRSSNSVDAQDLECVKESGLLSIKERKKMLDSATSAPEIDKPMTHRRKSAGAARLRQRSTRLFCELCGLECFPNEVVRHQGLTYHDACFKCGGCGRSLRDVECGTLDDDDLLYCSFAGGYLGCLQRIRLAKAGLESVREAPNQRLSETETAEVGTAKKEAVESIADSLESIIEGMVPRCGICGGTFAAADKMVMQGCVKVVPVPHFL